jgi:hypothetical protein
MGGDSMRSCETSTPLCRSHSCVGSLRLNMVLSGPVEARTERLRGLKTGRCGSVERTLSLGSLSMGNFPQAMRLIISLVARRRASWLNTSTHSPRMSTPVSGGNEVNSMVGGVRSGSASTRHGLQPLLGRSSNSVAGVAQLSSQVSPDRRTARTSVNGERRSDGAALSGTRSRIHGHALFVGKSFNRRGLTLLHAHVSA